MYALTPNILIINIRNRNLIDKSPKKNYRHGKTEICKLVKLFQRLRFGVIPRPYNQVNESD